jgi:DNA-binding protein H-NS
MITTYRAKLALSSLLLSLSLFAQTEKLQDEKELEVVNFKSIKKVLQQDGLSESAIKKENQVRVLKKEQGKIEAQRYLYPTEGELWGFITEYWLIKNAQTLVWDFDKPDYGLDKSFSSAMESLGFYQKKYKILLVNTPSMVRAALPGNNESIFLLSVPFIRSLDLSKLEISLLLFEDFIRLEQGYFKKNVASEKFTKLAGTQFQGQKADVAMVEEMLKNYTNQVQQKGYTFQQQFEVTKKMDAYLKSNPELWNAYFRLLGKIDRFIKVNVQYKDYVRLYPSPEMQVKWLSPEEKVL